MFLLKTRKIFFETQRITRQLTRILASGNQAEQAKALKEMFTGLKYKFQYDKEDPLFLIHLKTLHKVFLKGINNNKNKTEPTPELEALRQKDNFELGLILTDMYATLIIPLEEEKYSEAIEDSLNHMIELLDNWVLRYNPKSDN